jgi:hypothetical protein
MMNLDRMNLQADPSMGKLTPELLVHLESRVGPIPGDFARFLFSSNGGMAIPELEFRTPEGATLAVVEFCSLRCSRGVETLDLDVERWELYFGPNWMPVASDGTGNDFLMALSDDSRGEIYFRDHEEADEDLPRSGLTPIAKSFSEFLAALREARDNA